MASASTIILIIAFAFDIIMLFACMGGLIATAVHDPRCNYNGCYSYYYTTTRQDRIRNYQDNYEKTYIENDTMIPEGYAYYSNYCYHTYSCNSHGLKQIQGTVFAKLNGTAYVYTQYGVGQLVSYQDPIIGDSSLCGDSSYNINNVAINHTYILSQPNNNIEENGIPVYIYNAAFDSNWSCKMYYDNSVRILLYVFLTIGMCIFLIPFVVIAN